MKLILSSCDFLNKYSKKMNLDNIDKNLGDCKVLFIPSGNELIDNKRLEKYYCRLAKDGFINKENIYIFDQNNVNEFINLKIDLIYVGGGNTFETMQKLRNSNFLKVIFDYVKTGVIYIGGSCGAHIVTKSIEHVKNFDINEIGLTNYSGLGFLDGIIIPHYDDSRKEIFNHLIDQKKYNVYALTNDDSIVITDDKVCVIRGEKESF